MWLVFLVLFCLDVGLTDWDFVRGLCRDAGKLCLFRALPQVLIAPRIVEYATRDQAQQAVNTLSNQNLMGRLVYVREVRIFKPHTIYTIPLLFQRPLTLPLPCANIHPSRIEKPSHALPAHLQPVVVTRAHPLVEDMQEDTVAERLLPAVVVKSLSTTFVSLLWLSYECSCRIDSNDYSFRTPLDGKI